MAESAVNSLNPPGRLSANMKFLLSCSLVILFATLLWACSDGSDNATLTAPAAFNAPGPYPVGNTTLSIVNQQEGRVLDVELWYPGRGKGQAQSILDFAVSVQERDNLASLLNENPGNCVRQDTFSSRDLEPASSPSTFPLVVFSHCFECTRYSSFSLAERLASHGIAVAAPDHTMNTLFDTGALIDTAFLAVRANDVAAVVDELLTANSPVLPDNLQNRFDASRVGVAGHSFGAVTAGKLLQDDDRFKAGMIMAAPVENPVITGVAVAEIAEPTLYLIAREDNSIGELGNLVMRSNFEAAASPSWKVEVADAGHWSFSDIAGIIPGFSPGCGEGERQTNPPEAFSYLDSTLARQITATYGVRFFAANLLGDERAMAELGDSTHPDIVDVQAK
ncbi:MAG: lipase [Halioglobus sp.]